MSYKRLAKSVEDLSSCLTQSASELWIVMELKSLVKKLAVMDVRGLNHLFHF